METERTDFEQEYLDKITKIWGKKWKIPKKIEKSLKVVDSIDKIKWPKGIPANLSKFIRLAEISLKLTLLQAVQDNIMNEFPGIESSDVKKVFLETTEQRKQEVALDQNN